MTNTPEFNAELLDKRSEAFGKMLTNQVSTFLTNEYPGYIWTVEYNVDGAIVNIRNSLIPGTYAYVLHLSTVISNKGKMAVLKAGDEILQRAGLPKKYDGTVPKYIDGVALKDQPCVAGITI